jgi:hypothetical protein
MAVPAACRPRSTIDWTRLKIVSIIALVHAASTTAPVEPF